MLKVAFAVVCLSISGTAVEYSRHDEGYPQGLIPDCPGSWKPAVVKPLSLKKLTISVMGKLGDLTRSYNYYKINDLARNPDIDFTKKTVMYVGGYLDSTPWQSGRVLGQAYKAMGYNALVLETLEFTATFYPHAVRYMRAVGKNVAEMLVSLSLHGLDPKKFEMVGISLGGHTMGFIAKNYRQMTGQNISSIIALDPAGPCFRNLEPDKRLDKSDADFVLGIVTNMHGSGISIPIGHVTFYVNGGEYQPGHFETLPCDVSCSHIRSYFLWWAALLHPGAFIGIQCDSIENAKDGDCYNGNKKVTNTMDLYTDRSKTGIYYLRTSNKWPFALGKKGLKKPRLNTNFGQITNPSPFFRSVEDVLKYVYSY